MRLDRLMIKIFADGADLVRMAKQAELPYIDGFTTNPTLMRKAGIMDYRSWADIALECVNGKPISFEVLSDDPARMEEQARCIASWGSNIYVKIPVCNTDGQPNDSLIRRLSHDGVQVNVTAVMARGDIPFVAEALKGGNRSIVSIFAGRIADTGVDPMPIMQYARQVLPDNADLLWASTREIFNICQAEWSRCDIITVPDNILDKVHMLGGDLRELSRNTVKQFFEDAVASGYEL